MSDSTCKEPIPPSGDPLAAIPLVWKTWTWENRSVSLTSKIANISIKYNLKIFYKIFFNLFKYFLKKRIILNFIKYKFIANPEKKELSRWMIRNIKIWDESIINIIIKNIKDNNSTFIDVGCNYGAYSIPVAKIKNEINVYCFDPSQSSLDKLTDNIQLNKIKNIKKFKIGIGDKEKIVFFDDNLKNYKNSGSYRINSNEIGTKIKINSIDNLIEKKIIKPKKNIYIKLDIEGYEFFALQGLIKTLKKYNVIVFFEFSKSLLEASRDYSRAFSWIVSNNIEVIFLR